MSTITPPAVPLSSDEVIERYDVIAQSVARRYSRGPALDEDLVQVARLGLLHAARRFDAAKGDFPPFATATAVGEVKKHLRNNGWSVHVPRRLQEDTITVTRAFDRLTGRLGREPDHHEIAAHTGLSEQRVAAAVDARGARFGCDLEHAPHAPFGHDDDLAIVRAEVASLDQRERELVGLRFEADLSQSEIGARIGISQAQVHRRLSSVLSRLERRLRVAA